jgi:hypothetical protein
VVLLVIDDFVRQARSLFRPKKLFGRSRAGNPAAMLDFPCNESGHDAVGRVFAEDATSGHFKRLNPEQSARPDPSGFDERDYSTTARRMSRRSKPRDDASPPLFPDYLPRGIAATTPQTPHANENTRSHTGVNRIFSAG